MYTPPVGERGKSWRQKGMMDPDSFGYGGRDSEMNYDYDMGMEFWGDRQEGWNSLKYAPTSNNLPIYVLC